MKKLFFTLFVCLMCAFASATVYTWTGNQSDSWFDKRNWTTDGTSAAADYPKSSNDDVKILAGCNRYPVLKLNGGTKPTCGKIYLQVTLQGEHTANNIASDKTRQSARIENQHLLVYTEAFCDVDVTANRWVRMTAPLMNTYTGDFFVAHQTTWKDAWNQEASGWPYIENHFEGNEAKNNPEGGYTNRAKWSTYHSFYSDYRIVVNDYNTYDVYEPVSEWASPSNALGTELKTAVGFDVWVQNGATTLAQADYPVTFHFPSRDTEYQYYTTAGNLARRDPDTNLNRTNKGKFALSTAEGKWELKQAAAAAMFAVGNPAFAYLDIQEFLKGNMKNMSPFVYKHVEERDSRGYEQIYYADIAQDGTTKLYRINQKYERLDDAADDAPEAPYNLSHAIAKTDRAAFLNPTEGFRVMGGSVGFSCDEPGLVGVYSNSSSTPTTFSVASAVRSQYYTTSGRNSNGPNMDISMLKDANVGFGFSITTTDRSDYVRLNNFLNRGSVEARIEKNLAEDGKGKLIIAAGQPVLAAFKGPNSGWNGGKEEDADFWMYEDGKTGDVTLSASGISYGSSNLNGTQTTQASLEKVDFTGSNARTIKYRLLKIYGTKAAWNTNGTETTVGYQVTNPNFANPNFTTKNIVAGLSTCDIELTYQIAADGTVTIALADGIKMFLASDAYKAGGDTKPALNEVITTISSNRSVNDFLCEAWFAYDGMSAQKKNANGEGFIFEDCIGKYSTYVRQNLGRITVKDAEGHEKNMIDHGEYSPSTYQHEITIQPVLGSYNTVGILGLYPEDAKTMVMGQITKRTIDSTGNEFGNTAIGVFNDLKRYKYQGTKYSLTIPAGQLAQVAGSSVNPALDHYVYSHGSAGDMIKSIELTWFVGTRIYQTRRAWSGWSTQETVTNYSDGRWQMTTGSFNNDCNEAMVSRQGMQPIVGKEQYDGLILGMLYEEEGTWFSNNDDHNVFFLTQTERTTISGGEEVPVIKPGSGQELGMNVNYSSKMFVANPDLANNTHPSYAPSRETDGPAFMSATANGICATSIIVLKDEANNDFSRREDAPIYDVENGMFTFGSLAGTHLVGINAISELDTLPLFLTHSATLQFTNIQSLADSVYLYDAVAGISTLIADETEYSVTIAEGQQAGRYFLVGHNEAPAIETDVEDIQAEGYNWKAVAYCPQSGSLSVACADEAVEFQVYNLNGQLIGSAAGAHTFNGMSAGAYVVSATRGNEQQSLKVIVY